MLPLKLQFNPKDVTHLFDQPVHVRLMSHINFQLLFTSAIYVNFYASTNNDESGSGISQIMTDRLFEDEIYVFHIHGNVILLKEK